MKLKMKKIFKILGKAFSILLLCSILVFMMIMILSVVNDKTLIWQALAVSVPAAVILAILN